MPARSSAPAIRPIATPAVPMARWAARACPRPALLSARAARGRKGSGFGRVPSPREEPRASSPSRPGRRAATSWAARMGARC